jgi:hypothetical protein
MIRSQELPLKNWADRGLLEDLRKKKRWRRPKGDLKEVCRVAAKRHCPIIKTIFVGMVKHGIDKISKKTAI